MKNSNYYFINTQNDLVSVVSLWITIGSSRDPDGKEGLAHFFEHLFLNKTKSSPDKISVLRKIDGSGLFFNAYTRKNAIYYYFIQQTQNQEIAYQLLLQGLREFDVDDYQINREREVIINEQHQLAANPAVYVWNLADRGLWPNTSLGGTELGTKSSVGTITKNDILKHKELVFNSDTIGFLTISASDIPDDLKLQLSRLNLPSGPTYKSVNTSGSSQSRKILCEYRNSESVFIVISFPLPNLLTFIRDKWTLDFIRNYLASGWSSKLVERLRQEKNYTYWVYGGVESFYEAGYFRISMSATKQHIQEILSIISEEILKLQQHELSFEDMQHHKNAMKAHLLKHYIIPENMLWWYGWNIFITKRIITIGDNFDAIDRIIPAEVKTAAQKYLPLEKMHVAALGNILEKDVRFSGGT
ncbi:hypothetical protein A2154_01170 [Candidatus Gottesmanbacteria bacterium RBG_16_43_7]|uniref:Peptidase M16 N-terminal domain-containing protein n=1 Tax=Candidatus Gottesmanbacteria bacterium RBG_16_43_7 TaxID=1798373 RepID=A0A1F5ZB98_9BACT|nr:MAG: hypothetical protein A2154_01170 [Candidatus Gottesmanbacteria bacterium RBG_16_43_7]